jgi:protocatechuate 3,4-dioxygenase beta subunit
MIVLMRRPSRFGVSVRLAPLLLVRKGEATENGSKAVSQRHNKDVTMSHPEDGNFASDFSRILRRRSVLGLISLAGAGGAAAWLMTGGPGGAEANVTATGADGTACVKIPGETNGPYPGDGTNRLNGETINVLTESGIVRQDIRRSFGGLTPVADGIPVELELKIVDVGNACSPLAGHAVYVWHCDAVGGYSIYALPDANYLRGLQVTDANGIVRFTTIFPGCYDGRWPHLHFEVFASPEAAVSGDNSLLIAQLAFSDADCQTAYADPRYEASRGPLSRISFSSDNVFRDNSAEQLTQQTAILTGGVARVTVPVLSG